MFLRCECVKLQFKSSFFGINCVYWTLLFQNYEIVNYCIGPNAQILAGDSMEVDYENLLKDYLVETRELLDVAEQSVLDLEKGYHLDHINTLFRAIHTIKGNSAIFDLPPITSLSHSFENLLNQLRKTEIPPSDAEISMFLNCIDVLKELNEDIEGGRSKDVTSLIKNVESFLTHSIDNGENTEPVSGIYSLPKKSVQKTKNENDSVSKGKVLIPKSYLEKAETEQLYLFLVKFSGDNRLNGDSPEFLNELSRSAQILKSGILENSNGASANGSSNSVHYAILMCNADRERLMETSPIPLISATTIFAPNGKEIIPKVNSISSDSQDEKRIDIGKGKDIPADSYLKIPLPLLDHMINLAGETIIVRNQLLQKIESYEDSSLLAIVRNLSQLITSSQESVMRTRLQKLEALYKKIPRLIHDLERTTGKEVDLLLEGGEVELDKNLIDSISDPITHMIRNSVDHGIESPSERLAAGKPSKGRVILSAALRGGNVILKVEDDGRGLNYERIKEKAIEKGILTKEEGERKTTEELSELIFAPGFSTAQSVSSTSGRGVGMDVVKMNFQKAGGTVSISSLPGEGTSVIASLPQTLSIINCQMVRTSDMLLAIPQQNISELILMDKKSVSFVEKKEVYQLRGHLLPLLDLRNVFDLEIDDIQNDANRYIVVVHTEKHKFGLVVEEIENPEEIVVKPLSKDLAKINLYTGAAILGDGNVALILDITGITKFLKLQPNIKEELRSTIKKEDRQKIHYLLFSVRSQMFGLDSKHVLRIELTDPKNFEKVMDREIMQYRGEIVELCRLDRYFNLNTKMRDEEKTMILIQTSRGKKGILVHEIHNVSEEIGSFAQNEDQSSGVVGNGIVLEETVIVINPITILDKVTKNLTREEVGQV